MTRHGTAVGKRRLTSIFGVRPDDVDLVLAASGKGGVQFDLSYMGTSSDSTASSPYVMVWYPAEPLVTLQAAHDASTKHKAFGAVKGAKSVGIRVRPNTDAASAVAIAVRGTDAALASLRFRITGIEPNCATRNQVSIVLTGLHWHCELQYVGWDKSTRGYIAIVRAASGPPNTTVQVDGHSVPWTIHPYEGDEARPSKPKTPAGPTVNIVSPDVITATERPRPTTADSPGTQSGATLQAKATTTPWLQALLKGGPAIKVLDSPSPQPPPDKRRKAESAATERACSAPVRRDLAAQLDAAAASGDAPSAPRAPAVPAAPGGSSAVKSEDPPAVKVEHTGTATPVGSGGDSPHTTMDYDEDDSEWQPDFPSVRVQGVSDAAHTRFNTLETEQAKLQRTVEGLETAVASVVTNQTTLTEHCLTLETGILGVQASQATLTADLRTFVHQMNPLLVMAAAHTATPGAPAPCGFADPAAGPMLGPMAAAGPAAQPQVVSPAAAAPPAAAGWGAEAAAAAAAAAASEEPPVVVVASQDSDEAAGFTPWPQRAARSAPLAESAPY